MVKRSDIESVASPPSDHRDARTRCKRERRLVAGVDDCDASKSAEYSPEARGQQMTSIVDRHVGESAYLGVPRRGDLPLRSTRGDLLALDLVRV